MDKSAIAGKIQRLLELAGDKGATAAEIEQAMDRAAKLMAEHHLTEADLADDPQEDFRRVDQAEKGKHRVYVGRRRYFWEISLANFVADFVGCPVYGDLEITRMPASFGCPAKEGVSFVYFGVAEDAMLAGNLFDELRQAIGTLAYGIYGNMYRGNGATYCACFVSGLRSRVESQRVQESTAATGTALAVIDRRNTLVAYKHNKAHDWLKEQGQRLKQCSRATKFDPDSEAAERGERDGKNYQVEAKRSLKLTSK